MFGLAGTVCLLRVASSSAGLVPGTVGDTYTPSTLLDPDRVLLLVREERASESGYEIARRHEAQARPDAEGVLRVLWDERLVDLVPGEDVYHLCSHCDRFACRQAWSKEGLPGTSPVAPGCLADGFDAGQNSAYIIVDGGVEVSSRWG